MSHNKPFHRNYRGFMNTANAGYSSWAYVVDKDYAKAPEHYVRAFLIIQKDLQSMFEFIEPSDQNLDAYSYRIHELFMRACIEVEANFKAILRENNFSPTDKKGTPIPEKWWSIHDYRKVNVTHHLSAYKVHIPIWDGAQSCFEPFKAWSTPGADLPWYQDYNKSKHDRQNEFKRANFRNLLHAITGLMALLSAQFRTQDFSPGDDLLAVGGDSYYSTEAGLGGFFHVEFPSDWTDAEKYEFNWSDLKKQADRFQKIDYNVI